MIPSTRTGRLALSIALLVLTAFLGWQTSSLRVEPGSESMLPVEGDDLPLLREFNATFGADEVIVLAMHAEDLFSARLLDYMDDLTKRVASLPHVLHVLGPTTVQDLDGDELGPYAVAPYAAVLSGEMTPQELGRVLASHPLFGNLLVGRPALPDEPPTTAALLLEVERVEGDPDYRETLVRQVRELAGQGPEHLEMYVAGVTVEKVDIAAAVHRDQRVLMPLISLLLAALLFGLYRSATAPIVALSVVGMSLLWTLGLYRFAGQSLNPVTSLITPVVLIVSVAGTLHLLNRFLAALAQGQHRQEAMVLALRQCRIPCLNAAVTTAIGLLTLWMIPVPAIRNFALFCAAGVLFSYALTMTLAPLLLLWLPVRPVTSSRHRRMERLLQAIADSVFRHPLALTLAWASLLAVALVGVTRLQVETDMIRALKPGSPLREATLFIDRNLTGVNSLEIIVDGVAADDLPGLARVAAFQEAIRPLPGLRKVTGLPDLYARVYRAFHAGDESFARLPSGPDAQEDLEDIRWLLQEQAPEQLARYLSPDGQTLRLAGRATALDTASSQRLFVQIREAAEQVGLTDVRLTGNFVVLSNMSTTLVRHQLEGLVLALVLIGGTLCLQFRSLRLGLLGLIPTAVPILLIYGLMGWLGIALSVPTAMIACVALGMTVDGTIHLMARFRTVFHETNDYLATVKQMLDRSGRATVFASITLSLGFCAGALSSFIPSIHFAVLTGATLLAGLACVIFLLPLLLCLLRPLGASGRSRNRLAPLALLLLLPGLATPALPDERIVLKDQYGEENSVGQHRGSTVLLLYAQATGLRRMKVWEEKVREQTTEGLVVLRGLDGRPVKGKKTEEEVNERLRKAVPPEVSLLIDWDGDLAQAYQIPAVKLAVVVISPEGTPCGLVVGSVGPESLDHVLSLIAHAMDKGTCP